MHYFCNNAVLNNAVRGLPPEVKFRQYGKSTYANNIFENGISSVMKRERPTDRRTMSNSVLLGSFKTGDDLFSLGIPS